MAANKTGAKIAQSLLEIKAIQLRPNHPFTWASGWKSPIYCDNRLSLSYPEIRTYIKKKLAKKILSEYPGAEAIVGVATAGIAPGALVADIMQLPFAYIRPEPKKHGRQNMIEGDLKKGQKVVVVEDLVSTGSSSLKAIEALRETGVKVLGLASIFSYGFEQAEENFKAAKCKFFSLSDYTVLIKAAKQEGYVKEEDLESLKKWREAPDKWGV
jgi:orotate phosphoribosyltransferase